MSITVSDCLKLPSLREGAVVAGHKGLNHIVNNISVLEVTSDNQFSLMDKNETINNFEICLTAFAGIADDSRAQCRMIRYLAEIGDVGLVIYYVGTIVKELHPNVIATADRLNFPLIIMPPGRTDFRYSEAIRDISDLLFKERASEHNIYNSLAISLSKIPESRRTLSNLLRIVSDTTKTTLLLSDGSRLGSLQSSWPASNSISQSEIIQMFHDASTGETDEMVLSEYLGHVVHIFRVSFLSYKFRHYSLYVLDEGNKLSLQDTQQIVDLIQLLSELWALDEDEISNSSLIHAILTDHQEKVSMLAQKYHFDLSALNMLIAVHTHSDSGSIDRRLEMHRVLKEFIKENEQHVLLNTYDDYFLLFVSLDQNMISEESYILKLKNCLKDYHCSLTLMRADLRDVKALFQLYEKCHLQAEQVFPRKAFLTDSDILFVNSCVTMADSDSPEKHLLDSAIKKCLQLPDAESILATLTAYYLDAGCRIEETARAMYLHRNTVKYRLNKVMRLFHVHFGNSLDLHFMQLLAGYYRLTAAESTSESTSDL